MEEEKKINHSADIETETKNYTLITQNPHEKVIYHTEGNQKPYENSLNISKKFNTIYKNEELNEFKDEILSFFKERETFLLNKIKSYQSHIESTENKYENLTNNITLNYQEILSSQANLNNRIDKLNSYEPFVLKTNDNLTSHEIRINNLREDFTKFTQKYDKIYLDNLELPGFIGRCAKYKNCQLFFADVMKELNKFNNYKEKNTLDLKAYKEKLEQNIKTFRTLMDNNNKSQMNHINKLNEESKKECKNMVDILGERVIELRLENSKHSVELIKKTNEIKEQINKMKEMKAEILNDFYNKIDDQKNMTNNINKSFNEFKNEYAVIRKKFLELAEFIKDIRFKKNLGADVNKREINNIYKNLIKKNKKSSEDKNIKLLNSTSEIENMVFKVNESSSNNKIKINNNHEAYSSNDLISIIRENYLNLSGQKRMNFKENKRNPNSFCVIENDSKNRTIGLKTYDESEEKQENKISNRKEVKENNEKESKSSNENYESNSYNTKLKKLESKNKKRNKNNIFNDNVEENKNILIKKVSINDNIKLDKNTTNSQNKNSIEKSKDEGIQDKIKNVEIKETTGIDDKIKINENKNKILNNRKLNIDKKTKINEKNKKQIVSATTDTLSITDSYSSFYNNNTNGQALSDRNISNISIPISYNINNVKCNKFVMNDICQDENDNKIIKELASELEQSTSKKLKGFANQMKSSDENLQKILIQNIEPINLINNIKNNEISNVDIINENKLRSQSHEKKDNNMNKEIIINNENFSEGEYTPKDNINIKLKSLVDGDVESENEINEHKNNKLLSPEDCKSKESINNNECNNENPYNIYIKNNPEEIDKKLFLFSQKLFDIEEYMKEKFLEIIKQIDLIKQSNNSKKINQINQYRTIGFRTDQNIFNTINNDNHSNCNYSLNGKDENINSLNNHANKSPKFEVNSQFYSSGHMKLMKKYDYFKDNILIDNLNKNNNNNNNKNDDLSVIKNFIEKTININKKNLLYKNCSKKKLKGLMKNKNLNFINMISGRIENNENNPLKLRNNSTINGNDMKWVDLKVLINSKMPKNSSCQKLNPILSGENN